MKDKKKNIALWALIFGIISLVLSCVVIGGILGIGGLILGIMAYNTERERKNIAITAIISSTLSIIISVIMIVVVVIGGLSNNDSKIDVEAATEIQTEENNKVSGDSSKADISNEPNSSSSDNMDNENEKEEEKVEENVSENIAETTGKLGTDLSIMDLTDKEVGNYYTFVATFWSDGVSGSYKYAFSYYEKGQEYAKAMHIKDNTDNSTLAFLKNYTYKDEINVQFTAKFDGIKELDQQDIYKFTAISATQVDINEAKEEKEEKEVVNDGRYHVGDTITYTNGLKVTILDAGIYEDAWDKFVYVEVEVENAGKEVMEFGNPSVDFYGDDFKINEGNSVPLPYDDFGYGEEIAPGRKASGRCYELCNNYDNYSVVEAQIGDAIIVVKDNSQN